MASSSEPAAKRRKLFDSHETLPGADRVDGFITLAEATITFISEFSIIPPLEQRLPVGIKAVYHDDHGTQIQFYNPPRQSLSPTSGQVWPIAPSDETIEVLEDCVRLDPIWKMKNTTKPTSLARVSATVERLPDEQHGNAGCFKYKLHARILWADEIWARDKVDTSMLDILHKYQQSNSLAPRSSPEAWDPREFYENVHVPQKNEQNSAALRIDLLQSQLYPFQRRAVRWLLKREGVEVQPSGQIETLQDDRAALPIGFEVAFDVDGRRYYFHRGLGVAMTDSAALRNIYGGIRGGILAEEMGLGKTVELLALFCLHRRKQENDVSDHLVKSPGTLIITPPTILEQWKQEIRQHAPCLKVFHYEGLKSKTSGELDIVTKLAEHDIVLTTYNVIAKEVHYVVERPDRDLRQRQRYEPPKSPLTQISWWRVCLDEAQMVESGVSAAATVARLIPRVNAWAVSGTPLRRDHKDLFGLLLFLRYEPWCHSLRMWNRLVEQHRPLFKYMISQIAIRHSKDLVREDLHLPPQARHTISLPFTAIEEQNYSQLYNEMCEECGLDTSGAPLNEDWDSDSPSVIEKMRTWLTRLRQTCLHPEVGGRNRRALGRSGGPLRSVLQVLDVMIDQNDTLVRTEQRSLMMSQIQRGQMMENAKHPKIAMNLWQSTYLESSKVVDECRAQYESEAANQTENGHSTLNIDPGVEADIEGRLTTLRQRLRSALEVKHICIFFIANAYFQMKSDETQVTPDSEEYTFLEKKEEAAYEEAKAIRAELLTEVLKKANKQIDIVKTKDAEDGIVVIPRLNFPPGYSGIESRKIFEKLHTYCDAMNRQAEHFIKLRQNMIDFLKQSLIDEDEGVELKGDEYENSTKLQDEMYAYMEALRALFADRSDALSGQENTLIKHEMKVALKAAKEGDGPAPEILIRLLAEREQHRLPSELGSLRGIVSEIRSLKTALEWQEGGGSMRARAELEITDGILQHAQRLMSSQSKSITALEQEVNFFRETMNNRLDYYRALQKISDTVAPYEEENVGKPVDMRKFEGMVANEERHSTKLSSHLAKRRYLLHLKTESTSSQTPRICTICQCEFEIGTLTVCGHQFCKECLHIWYSEKRNCPVCKKGLKSSDFWDITYKPAEMTVQEETSPTALSSPSSSSERSQDKSIYSDISTSTLNEIKDIDLDGSSFGSKVDTICRHLLWLRYHDPGSKAIIFSQYHEFLDVLGRAFRQYKIAYSRFDDKNGIERFKVDPAVECFLLHAKAHSAGLNLVVANHVFLCEPLINTAIELQAIARVHRIGQHRATTVWMYLVTDSVEEAIYDISVQRRLAHLKGKSKLSSRSGTTTPAIENAIESANSLELQAADLSKLLTSGRSGGEIVGNDDLWQCLFGKSRRREAGFADQLARREGEVGRFLRAEAADKRAKSSQSSLL